MITHDDAKLTEITRIGIEGEQQMGLKMGAKAFKTLIDKLYSDKIGAVVRETCCNAQDSHWAAGKKDVPIQITIPTYLDPNLIIRDFGTGLPNDKIIRYFGTLFDSTKENDNTQIGTYGLGSKSPFALTDSYTVESNYNGIKTYFMCFKTETGIPSKPLITGSFPTEEENGITIKIPVGNSNFDKFREAVRRQLVFFDPKPEITNIDNFNWPTYDVIFNTNDGSIISFCDYGDIFRSKLYALMGNVLYPVDINQLGTDNQTRMSYLAHKYVIVLNFELGEVDIPPSREELSYDELTIRNVNEKLNSLYETFYENGYNDVITKPNLIEAYETYKNYIGIDSYTFGRDITYPAPKSQDEYWDIKEIRLSKLDRREYGFKRFSKKIKSTYNFPEYDENGNQTIILKEVERTINYYGYSLQQIDCYSNNPTLKQIKELESLYYGDVFDIIKGKCIFILVDCELRNYRKKLYQYFNKNSNRYTNKFYFVRIGEHVQESDNVKLEDFTNVFEDDFDIDLSNNVLKLSKMELPVKEKVEKKKEKVEKINGITKVLNIYDSIDIKDWSEVVPGSFYIRTCHSEIHTSLENIDNPLRFQDIERFADVYDIPYYKVNKSNWGKCKKLEELGCKEFNNWFNDIFNIELSDEVKKILLINRIYYMYYGILDNIDGLLLTHKLIDYYNECKDKNYINLNGVTEVLKDKVDDKTLRLISSIICYDNTILTKMYYDDIKNEARNIYDDFIKKYPLLEGFISLRLSYVQREYVKSLLNQVLINEETKDLIYEE